MTEQQAVYMGSNPIKDMLYVHIRMCFWTRQVISIGWQAQEMTNTN
jgi:hypothetical protein